MEEMETEPITQEPGEDESNNSWRLFWDNWRKAQVLKVCRTPGPNNWRPLLGRPRLFSLYKPNTSRISSPLDYEIEEVERIIQQLQEEEKKIKPRRELKSLLISPSSQWEEYICPDCDNLMDDPIQTSCGHLMCSGCFYWRLGCSWCPVRLGDVGQRHEMSLTDWQRDTVANDNINKLVVMCNYCGPMTVEDYRKEGHWISTGVCRGKEKLCSFYSSFATSNREKDLEHLKQLLVKHDVITQSECEFSELFTEVLPVKKYFGLKKFLICLLLSNYAGCSYEGLIKDLQRIAQEGIRDMVPFVLKYGHPDCIKTAATWQSTIRNFEELSPDQQQEVLTQVLKETLPAAKHDLSIDEIRPLLYQNGVITSEEATELLGIFTGEEKITRLYTKMLPKKGMIGLKKFMDILFDTGWDTPSHLDHHAVLLRTLSDKLKQIKSAESVLHQYRNEEAAKEAIVPMVYSESLPDAVINLSLTINKLLLPIFKEDLVSISEYFGLRQFFHGGIFYHEEKVEDLYMILPQKGVEGLKGFMKVLQDTGRRIPSHQEHLNLMRSKLQFTCLTRIADKLKWIESVTSALYELGIAEATEDTVQHLVYSDSLSDAVVNLSKSINKLLLPMLKKHIITISEFHWLTEKQTPEEKIAILYKVILPQKGVEGLQDYMELLQDTGKNIPRHQKHVNLMKSKL